MQRRNFLRLSALSAVGVSLGAWLGWKPATKFVMTYSFTHGTLVYEVPLTRQRIESSDKPVVQLSSCCDRNYCKAPYFKLMKLSGRDEYAISKYLMFGTDSRAIDSKLGPMSIPVNARTRELVRQINDLLEQRPSTVIALTYSKSAKAILLYRLGAQSVHIGKDATPILVLGSELAGEKDRQDCICDLVRSQIGKGDRYAHLAHRSLEVFPETPEVTDIVKRLAAFARPV